jgi:hypothetical protein
VADPQFGVGHTTTGSYLQVSGIPGLTAVNIALRNLIISEQAAIRANFRKYNPPSPGVGPGIYQSDPGQGKISASTAVVSVLIPRYFAMTPAGLTIGLGLVRGRAQVSAVIRRSDLG